MSKFTTEDQIETYNLELLDALGYSYKNGYLLAPDGDEPERQSYGEVLLKDRLSAAISRINPHLPADTHTQAQRELQNIASPNLINNNETFHRYLTEGITVEYTRNGETKGEQLWLIDWENPDNNEFLAVNQFTIIEDNHNRRPDIILFINGLPLVVIELKNAADAKADLHAAYNQLHTYKREIPSLFTYNALLVISDGLSARAGSLSADYTRFSQWKRKLPNNTIDNNPDTNELEILVQGMLNKSTLLDLIRHFTVFEQVKTVDPTTEIVTLQTIKKLAAYHQYYAVNKAVESVLSATEGNHQGGVVWHTQGSGKSLSMVFLSGKLVLALNNPTLIVLTDRNDLDDQLFDTFAGCRQLLRQDPQQANDRAAVRDLLNVASGGIVFTTVQKFAPADGETLYPQISDRTNIVVLADEAHRSQYGFKAKQVTLKDKDGQEIGTETRYGFAKYLRDAIPNATFVGFTGTPIEQTDKNTREIFGDHIDIYDIAQAVEDGATVPIYYESRLVKVDLDEEGRELLNELDEDLRFEDLSATQQAKAKQTKIEAVVGSTQRLQTIARDIVTHFEQRQTVNRGKGMIVTLSRRVAANLYDKIIELRPHWHSDKLDSGKIKVVMTASASDDGNLVQHHTTKQQRQILAQRLKDPNNDLDLVIVCDMWLTGFDAPCLHTMYIDKPMKGHNLMQAIARINRVYFEKQGGLIVDYLGVAHQLKEALNFYSQNGGKGDLTLNQDVALGLLATKLEVVEGIMADFDYAPYFTASTGDKLNLLKSATNYIADPQRKDRFLDAVAALSKIYALTAHHPEAIAQSEKISFFQAIQSSLRKLEPSDGGLSNADIESAIRQVIDQALVSDTVVNIFDEAGIKNPDVSVISEEFLQEVEGMEHKNLAVELLKRLLKDEIKAQHRTNIVQSRKLAEMLEDALKRYKNQVIGVTEVLQELIEIGRDVQAAKHRGEELGLEPYELAFYDALAQNDSARDVMGQENLRELAIALVARVRRNASIDWNIKESVRSRMKIMVKRLLRQYGYPPDMQALAVELVLEQAKVFTEFEIETRHS
ncbi:type I restriction endonuclease subunit R [Spirulina subsalsa FACHB-351]|uniref:Type I restriction enzyme endonuclease subunit n=1 Tax=Spirulina subsalsa FACHB-351 TaxID=234711 RepID=A0ABT3LB87_9CYAN|nr:type I restriction endonuclease subunit R [Spirulina subsalsa]MCW6038779.1 type I restriction endonuclease subunit R [Spirulina subsalsa FACHB-351]